MAVRREKGTTRKQILAAARRVFARTGFYQARVEDIAREAGVGKGTVYEYFTSKEELYREMLLGMADSYVTALAAEMARPGDPQERLVRLARRHLQFLEENGELARMFVQEPGPVGQELQEQVAGIRKAVDRQVAGLIAEVIGTGRFRQVDPEVAGRFFFSGLTGVILPGLLHEGRVNPEVLDTVLDLFLRGISKEGEAGS